MKINEVYSQVINVTQKVIRLGLTVQENRPYRNKNIVAWEGLKNLSTALKSIPYYEKFSVISDEDNFNFKFADGAFVQMLYEFDITGGKLKKHRLVYFPAPNLERYDENIEEYNGPYFGDSEFHDLLDKHIVSVPLRFDYSDDDQHYVECDHPYSHLTLGEFKNCRIPVSKPVTPNSFINFVLHSFYKTVIRDYCDNFRFNVDSQFEFTISNKETTLLFVDP